MADEANIPEEETKDIEMRTSNRPADDDRPQDREEETSLIESNRPNPNREIHVLDTSSIPNIKRDVGGIRRSYTQDKKDFFKNHLGVNVIKLLTHL